MSIQSDKYTNDLLEAITIVTENVIASKNHFDQTVIYTIKDNKTASQGYYTVTDGSITMEAYSENPDYQIDDQVYVLIPQGKYSNKKIILSKVINKEEEKAIEQASKKVLEIVGVRKAEAKSNNITLFMPQGSKLNQNEIFYGAEKIFNWQAKDTQTDFTRLQLKMSSNVDFGFKTIVDGSYGLKIQVCSTPNSYFTNFESLESEEAKENIEIKENLNSEINENWIINEFDYSVEDMGGQIYSSLDYGNPQMKIFNIENIIGRIQKIIVQPYVKNDFKINNQGIIQDYIFDNKNSISFDDIEFILGYGQEEFESEELKLYTYDNLIYSVLDNDQELIKHLKCRWIKYNDELDRYQSYEENSSGQIVESITNTPLYTNTEEDYGVIWYTLDVGDYSDYLGGKDYTRMNKSPCVLGDKTLDEYLNLLQRNLENKYLNSELINLIYFPDKELIESLQSPADYKLHNTTQAVQEKLGIYFIPDSKKADNQIKAVLVRYKKENNNKILSEEIWNKWMNTKDSDTSIEVIGTDKELVQISKDVYIKKSEKEKVIQNNNLYISYCIQEWLNNSNYVIDTITSKENLIFQRKQSNYSQQIISDLSLHLKENLSNFQIYNVDSTLKDGMDQIYHLEAEYPGRLTETRKNTQVFWYIPTNNTMIKDPRLPRYLNQKNITDPYSVLDSEIFSDLEKSYFVEGYIDTINDIDYLCLGFEYEDDYIEHNVLPFKIKSNYTKNYGNNTIYCSIKVNYLEVYSGKYSLIFGVGSTTGTNYSLHAIMERDYFTVTNSGVDSITTLEVMPQIFYSGIVLDLRPDNSSHFIKVYKNDEGLELFEDEIPANQISNYEPTSRYYQCNYIGENNLVTISYQLSDDNLPLIIISLNTTNVEQLAKYYNGHFELKVKLSSGIILKHKFALPVGLDECIGITNCNKIITYDSSNSLNTSLISDNLSLLGISEQKLAASLKKFYPQTPMRQPFIGIGNGLNNCNERITVNKTDIYLILNEYIGKGYIQISRGPEEYSGNLQNITDEATDSYLYNTINIMLHYDGTSGGKHYYKFVQGECYRKKSIGIGKLAMPVLVKESISASEFCRKGFEGLLRQTRDDIDSEVIFRLYSEKFYYHEWKVYHRSTNEFVSTRADALNPSDIGLPSALSNFRHKEFTTINTDGYTVYRKEEEKNTSKNKIINKRYIYVNREYYPIQLKNLHSNIWYLDNFKHTLDSTETYDLYLKNGFNQYYQLKDIELIPEGLKNTNLIPETSISDNLLKACIKDAKNQSIDNLMTLYTYIPYEVTTTKEIRLIKDYKVPIRVMLNAIKETLNNLDLVLDEKKHWWYSSPKELSLRVTGSWSAPINFDIVYKIGNKVYSIFDQTYTSLQFDIENNHLNQIMYIDNDENTIILNEEDFVLVFGKIKLNDGNMGPYDANKKSIDYFYKFSIHNYNYTLPPQSSFTWESSWRLSDSDIQGEFSPLALKGETVKVNNITYYKNAQTEPFPFYVKDAFPPALLGYADSSATNNSGGQSAKKVELKWIQPIIIYQDLYDNIILNNYQGGYVSNEENIFSAVIGAGKKNNDNTFSGVLLGQVNGPSNLGGSSFGLYGYSNGARVFGFTDSGKAFIGGANEGAKLEFNADTDGGLSIQSGGFDELKDGMKLDFTENLLHIKNSDNVYEQSGMWGEESITDNTKDLIVTANKNTYSYPFIIAENNKTIASIDWQGDYVGRSISFGNNLMKNTGLVIKDGNTDQWITQRVLGTITERVNDKNETYELVYYNVFDIEPKTATEPEQLVCYSFYRLVPKSKTQLWLQSNYLNSNDLKLYNEIKDKLIIGSNSISTTIENPDRQITNLISKLHTLRSLYKIHIDKRKNLRSAINFNTVKIAGLYFNNLIYQGEFVNSNGEFFNCSSNYFAYYDKFNVSTALTNFNSVTKNNYSGNKYRKYYYWGSVGGIYTKATNIPNNNNNANGYYFFPSYGVDLITNGITGLPKIIKKDQSWQFDIGSWNKKVDTVVGFKFGESTGQYLYLPPIDSLTEPNWFNISQAYRPFYLPYYRSVSADTSLGFNTSLVYKQNYAGYGIKPTLYKSGTQIFAIHQNVLYNQETGKSQFSFSPFYYIDNNQVKKTEEETGEAATMNRLQSRFAGFTAFNMENLLEYWRQSSRDQTDKVEITLRGKNNFGLDILNISVKGEPVFRITLTGDVIVANASGKGEQILNANN